MGSVNVPLELAKEREARQRGVVSQRDEFLQQIVRWHRSSKEVADLAEASKRRRLSDA